MVRQRAVRERDGVCGLSDCDDFRVEVVATEDFGIQMRWASPTLGQLTPFFLWDHLDRPGSHVDEADWHRPWTQDEPYVDADQNWAFIAWVHEGFVYVHSGPGFEELSWYRVPGDVFTAELAKFRQVIASPAGDSDRNPGDNS